LKLRVAYAKRRYKERTYTTPLVVTSYRDANGTPRNKTLASLAKLPSFIVDLIDRALRLGDTDALEQYVHLEELKHLRSLVVGPVYVVISLLRQLGVFELLRSWLPLKQAAAILAIVVERVIAAKPLSVMALQRNFAEEPLAHLLGLKKAPALKTWYAALARLEEHREAILQALYRRNHAPGQLYLYDITSSYFEGDRCELAAFGYDRDGKKGKKQIVVGIICEEHGCPIWEDVFKGNTSDQTTVRQQLLNLRDKLGVEDFTFVGDRGMVTHARIKELDQEGWWESFRYITALTRAEMMALVEDEEHPVQLELFDQENLVEVDQDGTRYVLCHNPQRVERDAETRRRLLAATEAKLESVRKNVAVGRWKKKEVIARRLYRWINRWGMERFFEVRYGEGSFSYSRRAEQIERYARLDGCYVIRSNAEHWKQTSEQLRDRYKDLKYVEQAFRTMKTTDIQIRPIRHFHEAQVRGHIFACFLACRVVWELRQRWEPVLRRDPRTQRCEAGSLAEIWRDLSRVTLSKLSAKGKTFLKLSEISPWVQKLLTLGKVPSLEELQHLSE
jgi:transposase